MKSALLLSIAVLLSTAACASANEVEDADASHSAVTYWGEQAEKLDESLRYDTPSALDLSERATELHDKIEGADVEIVREIVWNTNGEPTFVWAESKYLGRLKCYIYNDDAFVHPDLDTSRVRFGTHYKAVVTDLKTWREPAFKIDLEMNQFHDPTRSLHLGASCITENDKGYSPPTDDVSVKF